MNSFPKENNNNNTIQFYVLFIASGIEKWVTMLEIAHCIFQWSRRRFCPCISFL